MRSSTTIKEARRPTPEKSAIETNWARSEFSAGVEEMPVAFGAIALTRLWLRDSCLEISSSHTHGSMRILAQRQSAAGRRSGPATETIRPPTGFDFAGI